MTLAAIPWLSISINLLLVVFVIVCLLMTLLILMQRPKQEGLGAAFGGGVTDQVFGARTTNVLQKGTVYCGTLFFVLALLLATRTRIHPCSRKKNQPPKSLRLLCLRRPLPLPRVRDLPPCLKSCPRRARPQLRLPRPPPELPKPLAKLLRLLLLKMERAVGQPRILQTKKSNPSASIG